MLITHMQPARTMMSRSQLVTPIHSDFVQASGGKLVCPLDRNYDCLVMLSIFFARFLLYSLYYLALFVIVAFVI